MVDMSTIVLATNAPMKAEAGYDLITATMAAADALLREGQRLFRPHGLTSAQYNLLNVVAESPEGLSQRELSDQLVVDRSNVTGLLDRMEAAGWVRRADHPADRRVYRVLLTPAGRRLWEMVTPIYVAAVTEVTRGITEKRMRECLETLQVLERATGAWGAAKPAKKS